MIVSADIHLRDESEDVVFNEVLPGLHEHAAKWADRTIAILGDFWHVRYHVSVRLQNRVISFLENLERAKINLILLPGNHDQINTQGENALEVFNNWPNVTVYSKSTWDKWGYWIPYRKDPIDIGKALLPTLDVTDKPLIVWMHHGVRGAYMNNTIKDTEGVPLGFFEKFKHVFCGHYHKPQEVVNVTYIGSPYQTNASESGQQKRIGFWNEKQMKFIPVNWGKCYHSYRIGEGDKLIPDNIQRGDELRITVAPGVDLKKVGEYLSKAGYTNAVVTPEIEASKARLEVKSNSSLQEYAAAYIDKFSGKLDKAKLVNLFGEITQ